VLCGLCESIAAVSATRHTEGPNRTRKHALTETRVITVGAILSGAGTFE
jgi:hypothetical protein